MDATLSKGGLAPGVCEGLPPERSTRLNYALSRHFASAYIEPRCDSGPDV